MAAEYNGVAVAACDIYYSYHICSAASVLSADAVPCRTAGCRRTIRATQFCRPTGNREQIT